MPMWNPSLAIGVAVIDAEHQELFSRTDALLEGMRGGKSAQEIERLLHFLDDYCREHFANEQRLMAARRYPGSAEHLQQHTEFEQRFRVIAALFKEKGPSTRVAIDVQQLVSGWLVNHIKVMDGKLGAFLNAARPAATA